MCKNMFQIPLRAGKIFFMSGLKELVPYFYNHNKNLSKKIEFLENYCTYTF